MTQLAHAEARALVLRFGWNPAAYQILNPGITLWFPRGRDAVAGYVEYAHTWVVAGAPVCAADRLDEVTRELEADAAACGARVVYFGAGERLERLLGDVAERHLLRLGAQPVWDASRWPEIVRGKSSLRAQLNRARNKGVRVTEWPWQSAQDHPALARVLEEWLGTRGLPPLHFMTEPWIIGTLHDRRVFVAQRDDAVIAFLVATPVPARNGWLVEQWPRIATAPNGTTHLLVDAAMHGFAVSGARFVSLGLAPLSERAGPLGEGEPAWLRLVLHWLRAHGRRFYNFRGLDAFKASLEPERWEPIYAVMPGPQVTAGMLRAVAGAFSGSSTSQLLTRALWTAVVREVQRIV